MMRFRLFVVPSYRKFHMSVVINMRNHISPSPTHGCQPSDAATARCRALPADMGYRLGITRLH